MDNLDNTCASLRRRISETEAQLARLRGELQDAERAATAAKAKSTRWPMEDEEYARYGRQMIVPQVGLPGGSPHFLRADGFVDR